MEATLFSNILMSTLDVQEMSQKKREEKQWLTILNHKLLGIQFCLLLFKDLSFLQAYTYYCTVISAITNPIHAQVKMTDSCTYLMIVIVMLF